MLKTALHTEASVAESSPSLIKQAGIVIGASAVIAVCARLVIPLPFTPVPLTLANFGVLLIGLTLGSRRGFAAAAVYLGWGAIGLPVFSMVGQEAWPSCLVLPLATCGHTRSSPLWRDGSRSAGNPDLYAT